MVEARRERPQTARVKKENGQGAGSGRKEGLLARLSGWLRPGPDGPSSGEGETVETDGIHAVVALEGATAQAVVTCRGPGGGFSATLEEVREGAEGTDGERYQPATGNRQALALGMGLAEAGRRVAVLAGEEGLGGGVDLLAEAGRRRLPLVVHLVGPPPVAPPGVVVLAPATVQGVVNWTLLARALAERALAPVVVVQDSGMGEGSVAWPAAGRVERFLGRPGDGIHSPGVQELTHGDHRRRLPVLLDGRRPVLSGAVHGGRAGRFAAASVAAGEVFLDRAVLDILEDLIDRFNARFGRRPEVVRSAGKTKGGLTVVASGAPARVAGEALNSSSRARGWGLVEVVCLAPPPVAALTAALVEGMGETGTVVVLEAPAVTVSTGSTGGALSGAVQAALERVTAAREEGGKRAGKGRRAPRVLPVRWGAPGQALAGEDLVSLLIALQAGEEMAAVDGPLWLGMDFAPRLPAEPKRQVLHDAVRRLAPEASRSGWMAPAGERDESGRGLSGPEDDSPTAGAISSSHLPPFVRRLGARPGAGSGLASLPRFADQVVPLTGGGDVPPDPHLAFPVLPPLSAVFRPPAPRVGPVPRLDPASCTGCGACWTSCPHGAFEPRVLASKELLNAGLERARTAGDNADALRRVLSRLGKELARELTLTPGGQLGELLDRAFARLPATSREPVRDAFAALRRAVGELPVTRTEVFGQGEAFLLGLDSVACTGCGLCVEVCEPGALTVYPGDGPARSGELEAPARRGVATLRELPTPSDSALERAAAGEPGELGAALLDPRARTVMVPGEGAPAGSPEALALRRRLALAAREGAARLEARRRRAAELQQALSEALRGELAGALPAGDLDALARGVAALEEPEARLGDLLSRVDEAFDAPRVDVARLGRRVDLARRLAVRYPDGEEGAPGVAEAPCALVLGPGRHLEWAASFPWNPFAVPVVVAGQDLAGSEVVARVRGLARGWRRRWQEEGEMLVRVAEELEQPTGTGTVDDAEPPPLVLAVAGEPPGAGDADLEELEELGVSLVVLGETTEGGIVPSPGDTGEAAAGAATADSGDRGPELEAALQQAEERHRADLARQLADLDRRWRHHLAREQASWQQAVAAQVRHRLRHWAGLDRAGLEPAGPESGDQGGEEA